MMPAGRADGALRDGKQVRRAAGMLARCLRCWMPGLLLLLAGCGGGRRDPRDLMIEQLHRDKAELARTREQCQIENEQLRQQIQALSALPKDGRANPYELKAVHIRQLTNFYDKDGDGKREKLIVYVQPVDATGDVVKAAGTVAVQLSNPDDPDGRRLLGQWQVQPSELQKLWFRTLLASYRLIFEAPVSVELLARPLTVSITFTDYLTGQIFSDQRIIEPRVD